MKKDIILMHGIIHIFDGAGGKPLFSNEEMDMTSGVNDMLKSCMIRLLESEDVKHYDRRDDGNDRLKLAAACTAQNFVQTTQALARELFEIMNANPEIPQGDVAGVLFRDGDDPYFAFFKMNYRRAYTHSTQNGCTSLTLQRILPSAGLKPTEAFLINLETGEVCVAEKRCPVNGEMRCYLSELYLGLPPKLTGKGQLQAVIRAVEQVDRKYYGDDAPERKVRVKQVIWNEMEEKGCLDVEALKKKIYPGSPGMQADLEKKLHRYSLNNAVLPCGKDTEGKLDELRLVTDLGIEIICPTAIRDEIQIVWNEGGGSVTVGNLRRLEVK